MLVCEEVTEQVIGAAIDVHRVLGPGLLESAYEHCLCHELQLRGMRFERQVELPLFYKDLRVPLGYRADIIVEQCVVLELKAVERLLAVHEAQLLSYLKLSRIQVGLLLNFHARVMKQGILRRVL